MIGVIGTGLMGAPMAERLLANQVALVAYNRTPEKLTSLRQLGVELAASVPALLHQCNAVILMLSDAAAIQTVILAEDVTPSLAGRTLIQMGTIGPSESRWIAEAVQANGGEYLEAPVLGSRGCSGQSSTFTTM
ncbi:NAD(P)-dependent oxidoreductase [Leptolyngbya sp. 7M]|uniref:NAD(P)-dependent oxidoreductase n=1 Tax=Leptolyngbya sp. 7M TaxID=2812896 RepID=UPI001B8CED4A|nr:NAD(P)-binding domain-containing protein [Leptolyngbya sp. 7M]QYO63719.1 NAD(P)-binding domain-containing protein [Leptolyngbya sp. 7M]